jgi:hypothetical protein
MRRRGHLAAVPASPVPAVPENDDGRVADALDARIDGIRVRINARDEVVLQCGKASITLRRNGRVIIRGTYVETRSEGTNRIRGGQVRVN